MHAADCKLPCVFLQVNVDRDRVAGEDCSVPLKTLSRLVDPSSRGSQAMPLLLISKTASGAFSASEVWHAGVMLHDAYSAADA